MIDALPLRVLHPPALERWWTDGHTLIGADGGVTWLLTPRGDVAVRGVTVGCALTGPRRDGVIAVVDHPDGTRSALSLAGLTPLGQGGLHQAVGTTSAQGRPVWRADGLALPRSAQVSADLRAWPVGRGVSWSHRGTLYCQDASGVTCLGDADDWRVLADGVHLIGDPVRRVARTGAHPHDLPVALHEVTRCGDALVGTGQADDGWRSHTVSLRGRPLPGPNALDAAFARRGPSPHHSVIAVGPDRFAAHDTVFDLTGSPLSELQLDLPPEGAATFTAAGLCALCWPDGAGQWFDPASGDARDAFHVRCRSDDPVAAARADGDAAVFVTATGRVWRVRAANVTRAPREEPYTLPAPGLEELALDGVTRDAAGLIGWRTDGLVVQLPIA